MLSIYSLLFFFFLHFILTSSFSPQYFQTPHQSLKKTLHSSPLNSVSSPKLSTSFLSSRLFNARQTTSGGGKTDVITKKKKSDKVDTESDEEIIDEIESNYRLVLHDDDLHTIDEVVDVIIECCPLCPPPRAYEVTLQVHTEGMGTVCVANKKIIEEYILALQAAGLSVSMGKDSDFKEGDEDLEDEPPTPAS